MIINKADKWFSIFIRLRAADENGYGKCVTCGTIKHVKYMDCGHYCKRQHTATRYSEINCQLQCKHCNKFKQGNDVEFRKYLVEKHGEGKILMLENSTLQYFKRTKFEIEKIAEHYKQEALKLIKEKGIEKWF